jgi:hypothetical protein
MLVVVAVNLSVALEAKRNCIRDLVAPVVIHRSHMVRFNLDAAKPMTDTAAPLAAHQEVVHLSLIEGHRKKTTPWPVAVIRSRKLLHDS